MLHCTLQQASLIARTMIVGVSLQTVSVVTLNERKVTTAIAVAAIDEVVEYNIIVSVEQSRH